MQHQPGDLVDDYRIGDLLGAGGFADSYEAEDTRTGRRVVLKVFKGNVVGDQRAARRFRQEATITSVLDHPAIQHSRDDGRTRTELYLVLDYVEGEALSSWLDEYPDGIPIPLAEAWGREIADLLSYLDQHRVVHGDLKPANLLVSDDLHLTLLDFGAAGRAPRGIGSELPFHTEVGTAAYASPERLTGKRGDHRSDVYSWGVVMYQLLSGRPPFEADTPQATMDAQLTGTPTGLRALRPEVPEALEAVVLKAIRRSPRQRYQSARELRADLDELERLDPSTFDLSPEPPMAPAGLGGRALWLFVIGVAVAFLLVAGTAIGISIAVH